MATVDEETRITVPEEVALTPLDIGEQPSTDKGYTTAAGTKLRARIVKVGDIVANAPIPTSTKVAISPSGMTLSVTLAVLADDLTVAKDANGALLIMERHELVLSDEAMQNPTFDPQATVDQVLRQQAYLLEQRMTKRAATVDYLSAQWGHGVVPAETAAMSAAPVVSAPTA